MWTVDEAADEVGVEPETLRFHIYRRKDLAVVRIKRRVYVEDQELERFISARAEVAGLLSVRELAEKAGVDRSVMQRRLNGVAPSKVIGRKKFYNPASLVVTSKSV